jgi:prepilin-type processing-associated H-X9-DG protein
MRQLALAVTNYSALQRAYPGYINPIQTIGAASEEQTRVSWVVTILPYLERSDIYQLYRDPARAAAHGIDPRQIHLHILVCPSTSSPTRSKTLPPPCDYVANTGRQDVIARAPDSGAGGYPSDWRANGIFFNLFHDDHENPAEAPLTSISQEYITEHDGSSLTIMLSERVDAGSYAVLPPSALDAEAKLGFVWWPSTSNRVPFEPPNPSQRINGPYDPLPIHRARPSSKHPSGVNITFCDGHTRFISENIDYGVWCLLMTPYGRQCNTPGKKELELSGPDNNYEFLRHTEVDESRIN